MLGKTSVIKQEGRFTFKYLYVPATESYAARLPGKEWMRRQFIYHFDEFGTRTSVISPERNTRPQPSRALGRLSNEEARKTYNDNPRPVPAPVKDDDDPGFAKRLFIAKITDDPELLSFILNNPNEAKGVKLSAANNPLSKPEERKNGCDFCNFDRWGQPGDYDLTGNVGQASNPFRFAPYHDVHIARGPIHNLSEMVKDPNIAMDFIKAAFKRSRYFYQHYSRNIENMQWGMNYGIGRYEDGLETHSANASFQHLHTQLFSLPKTVFGRGEAVAQAMNSKSFGEDFFAGYLEALINHELVISQYGNTFLVVPWAQQSRDHFRIITEVPNFIDQASEELEANTGKALSDAFHILHAFKIRSFNCTSAPGPVGSKDHKLVIDLIPPARPATCELSGIDVVDSYNIVTADNARESLKVQHPVFTAEDARKILQKDQ